ncbi:MAG: dihydrodipicolinate synthase family protein [Pirellulaceae bacterium]|nr:dihydrodipicolinate synthase family protein [Planctomycetaceae bacterium]HIM30486.1 dihydrodipicolinate synthase family protein [Planctomycetota bacterium]
MNTQPISPETLSASVIAVPPLARDADLTFNRSENEKQIRHLEAGGVTTLLYGGNAVLYHIALSEYADLVGMLAESVGAQTLVIPSVGPSYGMMMDQASILRDMPFPTAMILPTRDVATTSGVATAVRRFVERVNRPAVLYIKHDRFIEIDQVKQMMDDGLLSWIKYAIVRKNTSDDNYLRELVDTVGASRVVSGIGEQPAISHMRDFGLAGFTSGCVCVAPRLSMQMLQAIKGGDLAKADEIRQIFSPLEDLRNSINPIRVLHSAVTLTGIATMGPLVPLLCEIGEEDAISIGTAAGELLARNEPPTAVE